MLWVDWYMGNRARMMADCVAGVGMNGWMGDEWANG